MGSGGRALIVLIILTILVGGILLTDNNMRELELSGLNPTVSIPFIQITNMRELEGREKARLSFDHLCEKASSYIKPALEQIYRRPGSLLNLYYDSCQWLKGEGAASLCS